MNNQKISASHKMKYCKICEKTLLHKLIPHGKRNFWTCYGVNHDYNRRRKLLENATDLKEVLNDFI